MDVDEKGMEMRSTMDSPKGSGTSRLSSTPLHSIQIPWPSAPNWSTTAASLMAATSPMVRSPEAAHPGAGVG